MDMDPSALAPFGGNCISNEQTHPKPQLPNPSPKRPRTQADTSPPTQPTHVHPAWTNLLQQTPQKDPTHWVQRYIISTPLNSTQQTIVDACMERYAIYGKGTILQTQNKREAAGGAASRIAPMLTVIFATATLTKKPPTFLWIGPHPTLATTRNEIRKISTLFTPDAPAAAESYTGRRETRKHTLARVAGSGKAVLLIISHAIFLSDGPNIIDTLQPRAIVIDEAQHARNQASQLHHAIVDASRRTTIFLIATQPITDRQDNIAAFATMFNPDAPQPKDTDATVYFMNTFIIPDNPPATQKTKRHWISLNEQEQAAHDRALTTTENSKFDPWNYTRKTPPYDNQPFMQETIPARKMCNGPTGIIPTHQLTQPTKYSDANNSPCDICGRITPPTFAVFHFECHRHTFCQHCAFERWGDAPYTTLPPCPIGCYPNDKNNTNSTKTTYLMQLIQKQPTDRFLILVQFINTLYSLQTAIHTIEEKTTTITIDNPPSPSHYSQSRIIITFPPLAPKDFDAQVILFEPTWTTVSFATHIFLTENTIEEKIDAFQRHHKQHKNPTECAQWFQTKFLPQSHGWIN